ncbi:hypothetical protein GGS26DRAFT_577733 [Hypomontagnella submonticulosa]|nr:hypothetical protein GGS26DRAFT_577733 [Hypomontagnella submonticulosa]
MSTKLDSFGITLIDTSTASSTVAGDLTPTHTTTTDDLLNDIRPQSPTSPIDAVPWPGHTFIIRDPVSGRQITIVGGELRLEHHAGDRGGYHWICVEKDGWLGFRDPVHNMYMGYNTKGNRDTRGDYVAEVKHHKSCEYFCARKHPDGGCHLLSYHQGQEKLWKVTIGKDGHKLVRTMDEGTLWEFIRV